MATEFLHGKVKWFDRRIEKLYGFIVDEEGNTYFFHFNDARLVVVDKKTRELMFETGPLSEERGFVLPSPGDEVVFWPIRNYKGLKASPWGYTRNFENAQKKLALLPPMYRVLELMDTGDPNRKPRVLWKGNDLNLLLKEYPLPETGKKSTDPLKKVIKKKGLALVVKHSFQVLTDEGEWIDCKDPRLTVSK